MKKKQGFSLIETIVSLGIIIGVLIPTYILIGEIYSNINDLKAKIKFNEEYIKIVNILRRDKMANISLNKDYELKIEEKVVLENFYILKIKLINSKDSLKKEGLIYVYDEK